MRSIIIIEDEAHIRNDLISLISPMKNFEVVGGADSVKSGELLIKQKKPDIVLLDIQLKDKTAFDLLNLIGYVSFHIIFVTAYSQHAIKAIKYGALDYLLKPVDENELIQALEKTELPPKNSTSKESLNIAQAYWEHAEKNIKQIVLRTQQTMFVVQIRDIIYCKSTGCYTTFYITNEKPVMVSKSIKIYEELLPEEYFMRVHQSYLVNHAFIKGYHRDGYLILTNGEQIPVSVRKRERIIHFLSK